MKTPYEFYKETHPDQFSDSKKALKSEFSKEIFDYFLESLTSKNLEKHFEVFCRKIAEKEICPNLIIQTGPTGGGDSKVDTETYPVSDNTALSWCIGIGRNASHERWAFAISAKKDWKTKIKSDVKKIIETDRGYKRIYFMSNQNISDKKRADTEDLLKKEHGIEINILDRNWIINKVFDNNHKAIAIEILGLSTNFIEKEEVGTMDFSRRKKLDYIEVKIKDILGSGIDYNTLPKLVIKVAILSRELELPQSETKGRFDRATTITEKHGTNAQMKECLYQWAWTTYWWHMDYEEFYNRYCKYEQYILGTANVYDLERLTNLWMNLYASIGGDFTKSNFKSHTATLKQEYDKIIFDVLRPNAALQAKANYINIRLFMGENIDKLVDEFIEVIEKGKKSLDFDFLTLKRMIMELPIYKEAKNYDTLFELLISISGERKQELETARLLVERSEQLTAKKPYSAIRYLSRAIVKLIKEESKIELAKALLLMARCFENIDLNWVSRGYYLNAFHISINEYFKCGELFPSLIGSLDGLKYIELKLGRLLHSIEFYRLEQIAIHLYLSSNPESKLKRIVSEEYNYDFILGIQIFRIEHSDLKLISYMPKYLEKSGLEYSTIALKYCLGYEDTEFINSFNGNNEALDDFITKWYNQPARQQLKELPWLGSKNKYELKSRIIGCDVNIETDLEFPCIEISESILAALEGFLSIGIIDNIFLFVNDIKINVHHIKCDEFKIKIEKKDFLNKPEYNVYCSEFPDINTVDIQIKIKEFINESIVQIVSSIISSELIKLKFEQMITEDNAFNRAIDFTGSLTVIFEYFGKETPRYETIVKKEGTEYILRREKPLIFIDSFKQSEKEKKPTQSPKFIYDKPPESKFNIENTKQSDIHTFKIINIPLWDKAKWRGVYYISYQYNRFPPVLSPIFTYNKAGKEIFKEWISIVGKVDSDNTIKIGIIKGINKSNPYYYRVIYTPNENLINKARYNLSSVFMIQTRIHTMEANTSENLNQFIAAYNVVGKFYMYPSSISESGQPIENNELAILKNNIEILEAWQVDDNSFLSFGILPDDNPVIPASITNPPILKVLERKRKKQ